MPAHILVYGPSGAGKSHLAASAPLPQWIALFDSIGNAQPYMYDHDNKPCRVVGPASQRAYRDIAMVQGKAIMIPTYVCYANDDTELTQPLRHISHYGVIDAQLPGMPIARSLFDSKLPLLPRLVAERCGSAGTFIIDSLTLYIADSRRHNLRFNDPGMGEMGVANINTNDVEDLCMALRGLTACNVILTAHIADREFEIATPTARRKISERTVNAPGRMARNIRAYFSDVWYCYRDSEGMPHMLTISDDVHDAKNTFKAERICDNLWSAVTQNAEPIIWVD